MKFHSKPIYNDFRPLKTRKITKRYASYRGAVISTKLYDEKHKNTLKYPYESLLERDLFYNLIHDYNCIEFIPQAEFELEDDQKQIHKYHVDCWALFFIENHWNVFIFEVKPKKKLMELDESDSNWKLRCQLLKDYCNTKNSILRTKSKNITWQFKTITEENIYTIRLQNILRFHEASLIRPERIILNKIIALIEKKFKFNQLIYYSDIVNNLKTELHNENIEIASGQLETFLYFLLYHQYLFFDYDRNFSFSSTKIILNFDLEYLNHPFYEVDANQRLELRFDPLIIPTDFDIDKIDKKLVNLANDRLKLISPLLEKYDKKELTRTEVEIIAKKNNISYSSIYRWIRYYNSSNGDWKSLIPKKYKRGNRNKKLDEITEEIIFKHITYKCTCCKSLNTDKAKWNNICNDCLEKKLEKPTLKAVTRRIKELPAKERKGTQGGYIEYEIQQNITGKLTRGDYPLHFVQVDSTILDIFVKDEITGEIRRPFITIFIDTKTRMLFSYWLTLRDHTAVDVNRGLMRGFLPKDEWLKKYDINAPYPIHGIPHRLQFDNGKIFDTDQVREFCFRYGVIDYQFRMVKRPDRGGFVERMFRTINESWLSDLEGYSPPLRNRPKEYRPDKSKNLLYFNTFKKWFLLRVIKYHNTDHSGLREDTGKNITPLRMYEDEMSHRIPRLPQNPELLRFEVLMYKESPLRPSGITFKFNRYNDDGKTGILRKIRAKNQGKNKNISWRLDPEDIREIWIYDDFVKEPYYFNVKFSSGLLSLFINKYPSIPITLRDYERIRKELRNNGDTDKNALKVCQKLEKECKKIISHQESIKRSQKSIKKAEVRTIKKEKEEIEIDWDNMKPLPTKLIGQKWNFND